MPIYMYHIERGVAWLNRGDDKPLKKIGNFADDSKAKDACLKHHQKAVNAANNFNRPAPTILFF